MKGIITLCGSTKFKDAFNEVNLALTMNDWIVLSVGAFLHSDQELQASGKIDDKAKAKLDILHKEKISLSQAIVVLNVRGYIGDSTKSEIRHAYSLGKEVYWLEPDRHDSMFSIGNGDWTKLLNPNRRPMP